MNSKTRAYVEVVHGNRKISDFIASADLGLTGAGTLQLIAIDYKPGEKVDEARVARALDAMIEASNRDQTDVKILRYKVLCVVPMPIKNHELHP